MTAATYNAYRFRAKEPVIDMTRTMIEDATGMKVADKGVLQTIQEQGGPTVSCMRGWFFGKTQRPQNQTIEAAGRALGYQRKWVKMSK